MKRFFLLIAAMACFIIETNAQIIHIPADQPTIQAGINSASEGDTVLVAEGTYFENINFRGKPITVASQFLLDGDTAHVSRTIIDGSQYTDPDSASVVLMCFGEDTTSVLMGFTITGGTSSYLSIPWYVESEDVSHVGGGVAILKSGGKIVSNIIELNHSEKHYPEQNGTADGGGLYACVYDNHTAIIRNNIIQNNTISTDWWKHGGGVYLVGGRIIFEQNTVRKNALDGEVCNGAGLCYGIDRGNEGTIYEVIIRNNIITENSLNNTANQGHGGGILLGGNEGIEPIQLYNNVIGDNYVEGQGSGVYFQGARANVFNNTIWNNESTAPGKSVDVVGGSYIVMVNNIIWSDVGGNFVDFYSPKSEKNSIIAFYNILKEPFKAADQVTAGFNTYLKPEFTSDTTYQSTAFSPAVGRGVDSLEIDGNWYYVPPKDLAGNSRANAVDGHVDLGAFESAFTRSLLPEASLVTIQVPDHILVPDFQPEILEYEVEVLDIYDGFDDLVYIPADAFSAVDYNPAADILSESAEDRTSTISVTSTDGLVENTYKLLYNTISTDATLSALSVEPFTLDPEFDPAILEYLVLIPDTTTEAPEVTAVPSSDKIDTVRVYDATFADASHMTTTVVVTPEAGRQFNQSYRILFVLETGVPALGGNSGLRLYPNPFSTTATVEWQVNEVIQRIELVNMLGQTVRTIEHPQDHSVTIDRENLASGIYFLKVYAGKTLIMKVMVE